MEQHRMRLRSTVRPCGERGWGRMGATSNPLAQLRQGLLRTEVTDVQSTPLKRIGQTDGMHWLAV